MWRSRFLLAVALLVSLSSQAQFGNEWINFSQRYFKFKVAQDDFYRISRAELQAIGFPVESVPASRIQLFREGEEVALNVSANVDNTLDFLEFYGLRRDGTSDTPLYLDNTQPHTLYNLFSDSATYFLTFQLGSVNGKRMGFSSERNNQGVIPEAYHLRDTLAVFADSYSPGRNIDSDGITLSDYDDGEGWTGTFFRKNQSRTFDFSLDGYNGLTNTVFETVLFGGNNQDHNVVFSAGPDAGSQVPIGGSQFSQWSSELFISNILSTSIGADNALSITAFDEGFPNRSDRVSVGYVRVTYGSDFTIGSNENVVFSLDNITERKAFLQIPTGSASSFRAFNITDPLNGERLTTTNFQDRLEIVVSDVNFSNKILITSSPRSVGPIREVVLPNYDLQETDYIILTDPLLRPSNDPIEVYRAYRESDEGGAFSVLVTEIDDLYNLFSFGDPTPLSISNFLRYANSINPVKHVFIIGKGFGPAFDNDPSGGADIVAPARVDSSFVYIPTYGNPGGDLMYSLGINAEDRIPGISIGRLNATSSAQVTTYLNKIIEMESLPYDDLFRKDFLQLSGGLTQSEINSFSQIIVNLAAIAQNDFVGGRAFNTGKQTNDNVEFIDISDRINEGVGYITFFGHSSGTVADIEVGLASDPSFGFNNKGKYPIFLVNGCDAGEIFDSNFTYGEDWIFEPDLGAINFIAHTSSAFSSTLRDWSNLYYSIGFADEAFVGSSIGEVMVEIGKRYFNLDRRELALTQIRQMQLQGDPAYRIFGADSPDYEIANSDITIKSIEGEEVLAQQDSFKIEIAARNFGRSINDSLVVQVNRTFANGSMATYTNKYQRLLREDTLEFFIPLPEDRVNIGTNLLSILIDPDNEVEELNEGNNSATAEVNIFRGNTFNLFPIESGVVSQNQVEFTWQSSSLLEENRSYEMEFDTEPSFDGINLRSFIVPGEVLLKQSFDFSTLALGDSTTIYWRTRFADPAPEESDRWVESSFTLINNATPGWGQFSVPQLSSGQVSGINFDELSNRWEFQTSSTPIDFFTFGSDVADLSIADVRAVVDGVNLLATSTGQCNGNTFNAIVFDRESGDPEAPILLPEQDVLTGAVCGLLPQRIYQFRDSTLVGNIGPRPQNILFSELINAMDDGGGIVMFSIGAVNFSEWEPEVITSLNQLGVSSASIASLVDGQPILFFGQKGASEGTATVVINDGSGDPITEQRIELQDNVLASFTSGSIQSTRIGPANSWEALFYDLTDDPNDNVNLVLNGIQADGQSSPLFTNSRLETIDVAAVDAIQYPQLEISLNFDDAADQTPPQLNFWQLNYELPADALVLPAVKTVSAVQEGQEISRQVRLINISPSDFTDSLSMIATLINQENGMILEASKRVAPPLSGDTTVFDVSFPSRNIPGLNSLVVEVSANENEIYTSNNRFTLSNVIEVKPDETNPIIDVTFDGFHILNGDVVSPNPNISIRMRDDNLILFKTDTTGFNLSLRLPGEGSEFQRINFSDPRLQFIPASEGQDFEVEFLPGPLEDGIHTLRVLAEDESGNGIRQVDEPYEVTFEVVNESAITHFYPYPNPFSTSCRFVFTLTGSETPSRIKIQIMTVSGRVVREITQDELGPIRIGNNITSFAWDGRDQYGDQLANGVYFYKVFIEGDGTDFGRRVTSADRAFKNGFGKLYILR